METNCIQNDNTGLDLVLGLDKGLDLDIDLDETDNEQPKLKKRKYGKYKNVLLNDDEFMKLKNKVNDLNALIEWFSAYIEEKGYKSKSHYLAILRWVIEAYDKNKPKQTGSRMLNKLREMENE